MKSKDLIAILEKENPGREVQIDFGWANSWKSDPEMVKKCRAANHKTHDVNLDPTMHGLHHMVICDICGYIYHYDSSG